MNLTGEVQDQPLKTANCCWKPLKKTDLNGEAYFVHEQENSNLFRCQFFQVDLYIQKKTTIKSTADFVENWQTDSRVHTKIQRT